MAIDFFWRHPELHNGERGREREVVWLVSSREILSLFRRFYGCEAITGLPTGPTYRWTARRSFGREDIAQSADSDSHSFATFLFFFCVLLFGFFFIPGARSELISHVFLIPKPKWPPKPTDHFLSLSLSLSIYLSVSSVRVWPWFNPIKPAAEIPILQLSPFLLFPLNWMFLSSRSLFFYPSISLSSKRSRVQFRYRAFSLFYLMKRNQSFKGVNRLNPLIPNDSTHCDPRLHSSIRFSSNPFDVERFIIHHLLFFLHLQTLK